MQNKIAIKLQTVPRSKSWRNSWDWQWLWSV